ncbi:MAG: toll/interleukin-1 receptor domain-containing protein [Rhodospirillaceae bacterium]
MSAPKVFISYSHDSEEHKQWVLNLAKLLFQNHVVAIIDQIELKLGSDLPAFMEHQIAAADRVLVICTDEYLEKAQRDTGGVAFEKRIISSELFSNSAPARFIPIIRNTTGGAKIPKFMGGMVHIDFSDDSETAFSNNFEKLLRDIHGVPLVPKPELGQNPFLKHESKVSFSDHWQPKKIDLIRLVDMLKHDPDYEVNVEWPEIIDIIDKQLELLRLDIENETFTPIKTPATSVYADTIELIRTLQIWKTRISTRLLSICEGMKPDSYSTESIAEVMLKFLGTSNWYIQYTSIEFILRSRGLDSEHAKSFDETHIQLLGLYADCNTYGAYARFIGLADNYLVAVVRGIGNYRPSEPGYYVVGPPDVIRESYEQSKRTSGTLLDSYFSEWFMPQIEASSVNPYLPSSYNETAFEYRENMYVRRVEDPDHNVVLEDWWL